MFIKIPVEDKGWLIREIDEMYHTVKEFTSLDQYKDFISTRGMPNLRMIWDIDPVFYFDEEGEYDSNVERDKDEPYKVFYIICSHKGEVSTILSRSDIFVLNDQGETIDRFRLY